MKLSIVIPVYNTQDYLRACLDSCLQQEGVKLNEDYEILCLNDGSKDHSLSILREYESSNGIRVVDKLNTGVSDTRNIGLQESKGKFIWYVDSDDYIAVNAVKPIIDAITNMTEDCLQLNYDYVSDGSLNKIPPPRRSIS